MKQSKRKHFILAGTAIGLSLLFTTVSHASDISFNSDTGAGDLVKVKFRNVATVTVDSVVIEQDEHSGCAAATRRHKKNLGGKAGPVGPANDFVAYLWNGCHYKVKFKTQTVCTKGDKDIGIQPSDFRENLIVKLKGNCTDGLKTELDTYIPNTDEQ